MTRFLRGVLLVLLVSPTFAVGDDKDEPSSRMPVRIQGEQRAPEFEDVTAWVNSKPLTMKGLKGKVVVVHFTAFG